MLTNALSEVEASISMVQISKTGLLLFAILTQPPKTIAEKLSPPLKTNRLYLALAPSLGAVHRDSGWDSAIASDLHLIRFTQSPFISVLGMSLGGARLAAHNAYRTHLELYGGTRATSPSAPIGLSIGLVADFFMLQRSRFGVRSTLWVYMGIAPYLRLTRFHDIAAPESTELEIGIQLPLPIWRW